MYHIKKDKRCLKSAEAITGGLEVMLQHKNYADISISDILRVSRVGRATFYRLFDTVDDVVVYKIDQIMQEIMNDYRQVPYEEFTRGFLKMLFVRSGEWINIVSAGRMDLIIHSMRNSLENMLEHDQVPKDSEADYRLAVFSGAALSLIVAWNEKGREESIDELASVLDKYLDLDALAADQTLINDPR